MLSPALLRNAAPARPDGARLWVGFSGGLDSSVLLHLASAAGIRGLSAVHVHHGLQAIADAWVTQCEQVCAALAVPLTVLRVQVPAGEGDGLEAAARAARHAAVSALMQPGDVFVTAHHADDQAETVLFRVLRGTGIEGLAAMAPRSAFGPGTCWRPLLGTPRAQLVEYAKTHGLRWIDDPHNTDPRFARAWMRKTLMPLLQTRWPGAPRALNRLAAHASDAAAGVDAIAAADIAAAGTPDGGLRIVPLQQLGAARARLGLRAWLAQRGCEAPSAARLREIERLLAAAADSSPRVRIDDARELRRYRGTLYLLPLLAPVHAEFVAHWVDAQTLHLPPGCGALVASRRPPAPLHVRFAAGGERLRPAGSARTRTLKNLFQEQAVPPWMRARMPLIYLEERLVAVADRWAVEAFRENCIAQGFAYRWEAPAPLCGVVTPLAFQ